MLAERGGEPRPVLGLCLRLVASCKSHTEALAWALAFEVLGELVVSWILSLHTRAKLASWTSHQKHTGLQDGLWGQPIHGLQGWGSKGVGGANGGKTLLPPIPSGVVGVLKHQHHWMQMFHHPSVYLHESGLHTLTTLNLCLVLASGQHTPGAGWSLPGR